MLKFSSYILCFAVFLTSCIQSSSWETKDIERKLKQVFPDAKTISVLNAKGAKEAKADSLNMPLPDYKALVSDSSQSNYSFIFYFYNSSVRDTSMIGKLFKASMVQNIGVSVGGKKANYVLGMPQFDKTGSKLVTYAVSLDLPQSYNLRGRDESIRKIFSLQQIKVKDVKLSAPDLEKEK